MKKYLLLFIFFVASGFLPNTAFATQYTGAINFSCTLTNQSTSCSGGGSSGGAVRVTGQAFTFVSGAGSERVFRVDACVGVNAGLNGICTSYNSNQGNQTINIPNGDTTAYRWGTMSVYLTAGPAAVISGGGQVTGRAVTANNVSDSPDPIQAGGTSVVSYSGADAWTTSIAGTHPNGAGFSANLAVNNGTYNYVNNGSSGVANYTVTFTGSDLNGNAVNLNLPGTINVNPSPNVTADIRCNGSNGPCTVPAGSAVTLSWSSTNASSCSTTGTNGFSQNGTSNGGISSGAINSNSTFTTTCQGPGGPRSDSVTVNISAPTVDLQCNGGNGPCNVVAGGTVNLSWSSNGATACTASNGWSGNKAISGSESSPPIALLESHFLGQLAAEPPATRMTLTEKAFNALNHWVGQVLGWTGADSADASAGPDADGVVWIRCNGTGGPCTVPYGGSVDLQMTSHHPDGTGSWAANCYYDFNYPSSWTWTANRNWTTTITNLTATRTFGWRCTNSTYGTATDTVTVNVSAPADNGTFISQSTIPTYMTAGKTYPVSVTMRNDGATTWTAPQYYRLGSANPQSNSSFGLNRVGLGGVESIGPGQQKTFSFNATPVTPGNYNFQWRMVRDDLGIWFGGTSTNVPVTVLPSNQTAFTLTCSGPGGSMSDTVIAQVVPNTPPVTSNVRLTEPNYCSYGPGGTVSWTYSDADSNPQSAYQIQVDDNVGFASPNLDTGKFLSSATSRNLTQGVLAYNQLYYARVRTWDSNDGPSNWQTMTLCTGPGCQGGNTSWRTPIHAYPATVNFTWTPSQPQPNQPMTFTSNTTTCFNNGGGPVLCSSYYWDFGGGTPPVTLNGNFRTPSHTYPVAGSYVVQHQATDDAGQTCPAVPLQKTVGVQATIPTWKEVLPK